LRVIANHSFLMPDHPGFGAHRTHSSLNSFLSYANQSGVGAAWPGPLHPDAYHGVVGDIVKTLEPHTEADPAAVLIQTVVGFGNLIGHGPHVLTESDEQHTNLAVGIVGKSAKARKGTSLGHAKEFLRQVSPEYVDTCIASGLSSGEGLIHHVRDADRSREPEDPGVDDKRLLVLETEFGSALRVMERAGNTLSPVLRQAWDDGNLRNLSKSCPERATCAHVSVIGHITKDELDGYLPKVSLFDGFANRFLWVCVTRSKCLPEGGNVHDQALVPLIARVKDAVEYAMNRGQIYKDNRARKWWRRVYPRLSEDKPGIVGSVTSRAETQVLRLALIYAMLDKSDDIRVEHLKAAMRVWLYCEASATYIFSQPQALSPLAAQVHAVLQQNPNGLTKTDLHNAFKKNKTAAELNGALSVLEQSAYVRRKILTGTGGRDKEVWTIVDVSLGRQAPSHAMTTGRNDNNEHSPAAQGHPLIASAN
jgi:hypothetical protein